MQFPSFFSPIQAPRRGGEKEKEKKMKNFLSTLISNTKKKGGKEK